MPANQRGQKRSEKPGQQKNAFRPNQLFKPANKFFHWSLNQFHSELTKLNQKLDCSTADVLIMLTKTEFVVALVVLHVSHFNSSVSRLETLLLLSVLTSVGL